MYSIFLEREGLVTLKVQELSFTFHNPNTEDETVKHISKMLAESVVTKVVKAQKGEYNEQKTYSA
jgi:hypothetical protein